MMKNFFWNLFLRFFYLKNRFLAQIQKSQFFLNPKNQIHPTLKIGMNNHFEISETALIQIEEGVFINDFNNISIKKNASLKLGKRTILTKATIGCMESIEIGEDCLIGGGTKFFDGDHLFDKNDDAIKISPSTFKTAPIKLGSNVWTGANCIILKGVTIGDNVIIGAGCVIHKDIPPNSVVINKQELVIKPL